MNGTGSFYQPFSLFHFTHRPGKQSIILRKDSANGKMLKKQKLVRAIDPVQDIV